MSGAPCDRAGAAALAIIPTVTAARPDIYHAVEQMTGERISRSFVLVHAQSAVLSTRRARCRARTHPPPNVAGTRSSCSASGYQPWSAPAVATTVIGTARRPNASADARGAD